MRATRLNELDVDPGAISTNFSHIDHMYSGRLSEYYYARFDQALNQSDLAPDDSVLEVGGGTGVFLLSLLGMVNEVHFSDISRENPHFSTPSGLLDIAGKDPKKVRFTVSDATKLPYSSNSFDKVFALDVLEHIPEEQVAIHELGRVTAPNGRAIISAPIEVGPPVLVREVYRFLDGNRRQTESIKELLAAAFGSPIHERNENHRGYDYKQTIRWLNKEFTRVSVEYCPYPKLGRLNPTAIITAFL
ncbi:methyltransferase family protein [Haloplanus aerogenes]|nr:methyltransferase family protein [Haloplanus aerogenes]